MLGGLKGALSSQSVDVQIAFPSYTWRTLTQAASTPAGTAELAVIECMTICRKEGFRYMGLSWVSSMLPPLLIGLWYPFAQISCMAYSYSRDYP